MTASADALTTSDQAFAAVLRAKPEGTIALFGPRGAGKSTLLDHCVEGRFDASDTPLPVTVRRKAPIAYKPGEFYKKIYELLREQIPADASSGKPLRDVINEHVKHVWREPTKLSPEQWMRALHKLAKLVTASRPLRIVIDDLDRVALAKDLEAFLEDMRTVFALPGCQRVIASSDAIDVAVLDPFVDVIFRMDGLRLEESAALLAADYPEHDARMHCLVHCAAGGLPGTMWKLAWTAFGSSVHGLDTDDVVKALARLAVSSDGPGAALLRTTLITTFSGDIDQERFDTAVARSEWPGSFDSLAQARRLIYTDPVQATTVLNDFRRAWDLDPLEVEAPEPAGSLEEPQEEPQERHPLVVELETERLPQLIGAELEADQAQLAIKRMNLDRAALAAEVLRSPLVNETVLECSDRLAADIDLLDRTTGKTKNRLRQLVVALSKSVVVIPFALTFSLAVTVISVVVATITIGLESLLSEDISAKRAVRRRNQLIQAWEREVVTRGVTPATRLALNKALEPILWYSLVVTDRSGLSQTTEDRFVVDTQSVVRFNEADRRIRAGAIGLAGPRGSGKSTLIHRKTHDKTDHVAVQVSAPVRYEPRDFALHLHAQLCHQVIRLQSRQRTVGDLHPDWQSLQDNEQLRRQLMRVLRVIFWAAMAFAGVAIWAMFLVGRAAPLEMVRRVLARAGDGTIAAWLVLIFGAAAAVVAVSLLLVACWLRLRKKNWSVARALRATVTRIHRRSDRDLLADLAERELKQIRFLQTYTTGWSGKLTLPFKFDLTRTKTTQLAQRPLTLPEIIERLRSFIAQIADEFAPDDGSAGVVIGVDELDKVEPAEDAHRFINDLKGVFGVPCCQFLVSVSEEALTAFDRRGLVFRDAFDSAFDEIVRVGYLSLRDADDLLSKRVTGMSEPFRYLCHCLSGGLPRELIRVARTMTDLSDTMPTLAEVTQRLVVDELTRKISSMQEAAAKIGADADVADFVRTMQSCVSNPTPEALLRSAPRVMSADSPISRLQLEARVYLRYAATLLQVFDNDLNRAETRIFSAVPEDHSSFDTLATVLQQLATQPMVAAMTLERFRTRRRLSAITNPGAGTFAACRQSLPPDVQVPVTLEHLCHCLSGGVRHVLISAARKAFALYNQEPSPSLGQVVHRLVRDDLHDKLDQLHDRLLKLGHGPDVKTLRQAVAGTPVDSSAAELLALAGQEVSQDSRLATFRQEYRNHLRFAATLLQVFSSGNHDGTAADLDALATVPQLVDDGGEAARVIDQARSQFQLQD